MGDHELRRFVNTKRAKRGSHWFIDTVPSIIVDGEPVMAFAVVDQSNEECLDVLLSQRDDAEDLAEALEELMRRQGTPEVIYTDGSLGRLTAMHFAT